MQLMIAWDDLRILLALRYGSLAAAARILRVDATTVGRRLAASERALGTRLFTRTPEGLRPTAAGLRALAVAEQSADAISALERDVAGSDERVAGRVRITSGDGVLVHALAPALPTLVARHPLLQVELLASSRPVDLARGEADVAVRLFRPRESVLVARRAATLRCGLFASHQYLERAGTPSGLADLARHDFIGFDSSLAATPEMRWAAQHVPPERLRVRGSTIPVVLAACRAGVGIAVVAELFAVHDPELTRLLPRVALPSREAWVVTHPDLRRAARIVAVTSWITSALANRRTCRSARKRPPHLRSE
jgi:DNA-binding transcriptional LysR family regulator